MAGKDRGIRVLTVYGGVPYEPQLDALAAGVEVVVGTPGRLIDLMNRRALDISHVKSLVLDEADEMLDLGFLPDVERLLKQTPETRQTMLFSATMPAAIVSLARTHMRHPMNIRAESAEDDQMVPATAQFIYQAHDLDKPEMIGRLLQAEGADLMIVFTRTKRQAQRIADDLEERGFSSSAAARRHGPGRPRARAHQVPRRQAPGARRHRRRRPRHRRHRGHPRRELHLPRGREDLRAPHRPHRPRGCDRHRDHVRRLGRPAPLEDDQQGARPALRRAAGDLLQLRALPARPGHRARHQGTHRPRGHRRAEAAPRERRSRRPFLGGRGQGGRGSRRTRPGAADAARAGPATPAAAGSSRPQARSPATVRRKSRNRNRRRTRGGKPAAAGENS